VSSKSDDNELNKGLNDQEFNEYLRRESEVSQAYRELPSRNVPSALEQRVLHQAQTRTTRKSAAPRWLQWGAPLAVAASALLTVAVLLRTTPEDTTLQAPVTLPAPEPPAMESNDVPLAAQSERSLLESDELRDAAPPPRLNAPSPSGPARARSSDTAQVPEPASPPPPASAPRRDVKAESPRQESLSRSAGDDKAKTSAGAAQPARAAAEEREQNAGGESRNYGTANAQAREAKRAQEAPAAEKQAAKPVETPVEAATNAIQTVTRVAPPGPPDLQVAADRKVAPETLLQQLRELRAQGKTDEAAALFKRLRAAYPDFAVSAEDVPQ